jgi:hypothetical protein
MQNMSQTYEKEVISVWNCIAITIQTQATERLKLLRHINPDDMAKQTA